MSDDIDAAGLAGLLVSLETVRVLVTSGTLTPAQARDIIDSALLNLETNQYFAGPDDAVARRAREILSAYLRMT